MLGQGEHEGGLAMLEMGAAQVAAPPGQEGAEPTPPPPQPLGPPPPIMVHDARLDAMHRVEGREPPLDEKMKGQLEVAQKIGTKDFPHWNTKDKNFPKENKPGAPALVIEVQRQDPEQQPKNWSVPKLCEFLRDNPLQKSRSRRVGRWLEVR